MTFSCECAVPGLEGVGRGLGWLKLQGGAQTGLAVGLQGRALPRHSDPQGLPAPGVQTVVEVPSPQALSLPL